MNKPSIMTDDLSKRIIQFFRKKTVILICFLLFDAIILLNYVFYFYTKAPANMTNMLIRLSGFIIYCITAFLAYKNIKIAVRLMAFLLLINGIHCFTLSFFFGLSQFIQKVTGMFAGLYWIYGAIILFNEKSGECGKEG